MAQGSQAMKFEEIGNEGLQHEFKVVVSAKTLASRAEERLNSMKDRARIPGFRPGKVPVAHLKKLYGRSVMAEVLNDTFGIAAREIANEKKIKLAGQPKIDIPQDEKAMEAVIDGTADLSFTMKVEVLPQIDLGDFKKIKLTKDVTEVSEQDVEKAISRIADGHRHYHPEEGRAAGKEDRVLIDYEGSVDGVPFEGGKSENATLILGSNQFIPGFEDQLVGAKAGEDRTLEVTFPDAYPAPHLAGKKAQFKVQVKEVAAVEKHEVIDDHFAEHLGFENLAKLKEAVREQIAREDAHMARAKLKRRLLDALDEGYDFELPPSLVEQEFDAIWKQIEAEMKQLKQSFSDHKTTEEEARENYRAIAARRVRLGLLLAEVGERNKIEVGQEELGRALSERLRQYPGQEKQVYEFYQKNPQALGELRAPLYEDKVVDFIFELAEVSENKVSREELFKPEDESESLAKGAAKAGKGGAKKPAAKKAKE